MRSTIYCEKHLASLEEDGKQDLLNEAKGAVKVDWLNQSLSMLLVEYAHEPNRFNFKLSRLKANHGKHRLASSLTKEELDNLPF